VARIACPEFIGRGEESRALDAALERASAGAAPTVLVGGEAGIGKSRLVAELGRRAHARVLVGGCAPFGSSAAPLAPVVEALRQFTGGAGSDERARLLAVAPALAWLLPELAPAGSAPPPERFESGQSAVFEAVLATLGAVAAESPLVVVLEDLHWADRSTLELLALRMQSARVPGCLLVATYRSDELGPGHPLRLLLAELGRGGRAERLELRRFARDEVVAQVAGILGHAPGHAVVEDVWSRSDGNPFLAEELVAAGEHGEVGAPATVRDIVLARVETLSEPGQRVLRTVSVARRSLGHTALGTVAAIGERELDEALREALGRHLLVRAGDNGYAFRHALTREVVYAGLLAGERTRMHTQLALHLAPGATPELLAERAHHWYMAGENRRALESAVAAGLAVDGVYAHAEALTQYERALELWDRVEEPERLAGLDRVALRGRAAEAASCLGEPLRAAQIAQRALDELDPGAEPVRAALLLERIGRYSWIAGDTVHAVSAYEAAVRTMPAGASAERARVLAALGHAQMVSDRYRVARGLCAEGLEIARLVGARVEEGRALATLGAATAALGQPAEGLRTVRQGRALLERAAASPDFIFMTYSYEALALLGAADFSGLVDALRPGLELMRRMGMHRSHESWLDALRAAALLKLGRFQEAEAVLEAALLRDPTGIIRRVVQLLRGELALAQGRLAEADEALGQGRSATRAEQPFAGKLFELSVGLHLARREFDAAREEVGRGLRVLESLDDGHAIASLCRTGLQAEADRAQRARAGRRAADAHAAVAAAGELIERIRGVAGDDAELPALRLAADAELARAVGEPGADAWLGVADAWEALGEPYPRAYSLLRAVEAGLDERVPKAGLGAPLASARAIALELGAKPLADAAESIARRGRLPMPAAPSEPARPLPASQPLGLTPRELEVLRLVGRGYTNTQIAERLFISRKTASAHVSSILGKLGAGRRAEAAVIAARLDLLDEPSSTGTR
jgi:DNA-binding CsgD family transcriptional regulator/tetratricopeptide (TPR) repeat protein